MKVKQSRWKMCVVAGAAMAFVAGMVSTVPSVYAGGTIKVDDDKWISVGMGVRTSFTGQEDSSANGREYSNEFGIDNARIYLNGKIHKYVGFEFNTDCFKCNSSSNANLANGTGVGAGTVGLLDAIGKFEFNELVNIWVGRMLMPTERGELNGPFYHAVYDGFRTPFNPADFSSGFGAGGAGLYGRDNGATFYGKVHPGGMHLQYVAGVYNGERSGIAGGPIGGPNQGNSLKYVGRVTLNLLNDEKNPGYYTSGTYYGTGGDILAIAGSVSHQKDGSGSSAFRSDYTSLISDLLFEKVLPNDNGVFTLNAEYKRIWAGNLSSFGAVDNTPVFGGTSWTAYALYLLPQEIGIGRFQPYGRYTFADGAHMNQREEWELGTNYVISGHNARISAFWRYGDLTSNGGPAISASLPQGPKLDSFTVALQMQY